MPGLTAVDLPEPPHERAGEGRDVRRGAAHGGEQAQEAGERDLEQPGGEDGLRAGAVLGLPVEVASQQPRLQHGRVRPDVEAGVVVHDLEAAQRHRLARAVAEEQPVEHPSAVLVGRTGEQVERAAGEDLAVAADERAVDGPAARAVVPGSARSAATSSISMSSSKRSGVSALRPAVKPGLRPAHPPPAKPSMTSWNRTHPWMRSIPRRVRMCAWSWLRSRSWPSSSPRLRPRRRRRSAAARCSRTATRGTGTCRAGPSTPGAATTCARSAAARTCTPTSGRADGGLRDPDHRRPGGAAARAR